MDQLFGPTLLSKPNEQVDTATKLAGLDAVGIYFSAHWCGPCRNFTPKLTEAYKTMTAAGKRFEVVFVSSDRDQEAFDEYYKSMPWAALPFAERDRKNELSQKYKVRGIPTLVIVDGNGETITTKGRGAVSADPKGIEFPWAPKSLEELLGNRFMSKDGDVSKETFSGKHVALYFSAHWCPPCRGFTPVLVETYNALKARGNATEGGLEVIFVSSDSDESSFNEYFAEMPWLALPYELRDAKAALSERFGVSGIPSLVILDPDLNVINDDARSSVSSDKTADGKHEGYNFPWIPPLVPELDEATGFINDVPTLVVLAENVSDDVRRQVREVLTAAAEKAQASAGKGGSPKIRYTIAGPTSELATRIRSLTKLGDPSDAATTDVIVLDIGGNSGYHAQSSFEVTAESIAKITDDFFEKTLTFVSL